MGIKLLKILNIFIFCVSLLLICFLPCSKYVSNAHANNNESINQVLINPNMNINEWTILHGGKSNETSTFTPFDYQSKTRMSGISILPSPSNIDGYKRFENASFKLLSNGGLSKENNLSVGLWIYFADVSVHGLKIKLEVDENNYLVVDLTKQQVIDYFKKTENLNEQAFAWNYLEIPLKSFSVVGNIYENNNLKMFNNVIFSYTSEVVENSKSTFASFRFYGLYLHSSTVNQIAVTTKQDYSIYSFNFWGEEKNQSNTNIDYSNSELLNNKIEGDFISSNLLQNAINYAWVGELNLLEQNNIISWQIVVISPSGETKNYNFGEQIIFDQNGYYTVSYRAKSLNDKYELSLYHSIYVYVRSDKLVYFDFSEYNLNVDEKKTLNLKFDPLIDLESVEIEEIVVGDNKKLKITQIDNNNYYIEGLEDGETCITLKVSAKRINDSKVKIYTATTNILINNSNISSNFIIPILITLGVIFLFGLVIVIKSIILSRKNDVK